MATGAQGTSRPDSQPAAGAASEFRPCVVIPCFRHGGVVVEVVQALQRYDLPVIVVDDGSPRDEFLRLQEQLRGLTSVHLIRREENGGKGAAVSAGLRWAGDHEFTHAIQIDADRQHDPSQLPRFLEAARSHPAALILGKPIFGDDVPRSRRWGRQLSRVCTFLATLSFQIQDPLFGYRLYPLWSTLRLLDRSRIPLRMDFDPELAVRLHWTGIEIINIPTPVVYPEGGVSNFRLFRDNARLSWMHTRLILGMLLRSPRLILRRFFRGAPQ